MSSHEDKRQLGACVLKCELGTCSGPVKCGGCCGCLGFCEKASN